MLRNVHREDFFCDEAQVYLSVAVNRPIALTEEDGGSVLACDFAPNGVTVVQW